MSIMAMYTTTCIRLVHMNSLVFLGLVALFLVVGVRLVPMGFIRLITLITLVTLVTLTFDTGLRNRERAAVAGAVES